MVSLVAEVVEMQRKCFANLKQTKDGLPEKKADWYSLYSSTYSTRAA